MKLKKCVLILSFFFLLVSYYDMFTHLKYDINLIDYFKYSLPYTEAEKEYMKKKETIVFSPDNNAPPLSYKNVTTGAYEGLIIDYMSSISIESGMSVACEPQSWGKVFAKIKNNEADTSDIYESEERKKDFLFTQPIYSMSGAVVVNTKNIESLSDLEGKKIAVIEDDYAKEILEHDKEKYMLITVRNVKEGLDELSSGKVDALAGDAPVIDYYLKRADNNKNIYMIDESLFKKNVTLGVNKNNKELLAVLNKTILHLKKKNVLEKAQEKWFGISSPDIKKGAAYDITFSLGLAVLAIIIIIALWNITMKKKIKEKTWQLEVNKENLHTIINSLDTRLVVIDSEQTILECNSAVKMELNVNEEKILGSNLSEFPILKFLYMQDCDGAKKQITYNNRYFELTKQKLLPSLNNTLLAFEDITETIIYEQKIRQEVKMAAVNNLSAGFAHEVRNPLGTIRNNLYILRSETSSSKGKTAVESAEKTVNRINSLINNLLYFSKVETEHYAEIDIYALLENAIRLEGRRLKMDNIDVNLTANQNSIIESNPESLKIIFLNLMDNALDAIKASLENGNIDHGIIDLDIYAEKNTITVTIKDNGIGMSENQQNKIYEAFFTTKSSGTGLGLYLVENELLKINGTINVDSTPDIGTTFKVTLPRKHI